MFLTNAAIEYQADLTEEQFILLADIDMVATRIIELADKLEHASIHDMAKMLREDLALHCQDVGRCYRMAYEGNDDQTNDVLTLHKEQPAAAMRTRVTTGRRNDSPLPCPL